MIRTFFLASLLLFISCSPEPEQPEDAKSPILKKGCNSCHGVIIDDAHNFPCADCHGGDQESGDKEQAHTGLISRPAHPENMKKSCGSCHESIVEQVSGSQHFTLKNEINLVRRAFGAIGEIEDLTRIPQTENPVTPLELSDDLLRRRCLRCHVYYSGDRYPAIIHGTGCGACHLSFSEGKLETHTFRKTPEDRQCLQCHYGNFVGSDYYGRYEHDMNDEYRTPYTTNSNYFRPWGIEFHELVPDIHQQSGLVCVDCHSGNSLMGIENTSIKCENCHSEKLLKNFLPANIMRNGSGYLLVSRGTGKKLPLPLMKHPAHEKYNNIANCQVCHARWSFNDFQTHLLRSDLDEFDDFSRLSVQGSFEVEKILRYNLDDNFDELAPAMSDKITGQQLPGLWYKGYTQRRWEQMIIGHDLSGKLQVMRPILDFYLSWVDEDGEVRMDSVPTESNSAKLLPYTPHTTGKAGLFYEERLKTVTQGRK